MEIEWDDILKQALYQAEYHIYLNLCAAIQYQHRLKVLFANNARM